LAAGTSAAGETGKPVSFFKDVRPLLSRSCVGCHQPGKLKGKLDLSSHASLRTGGKSGPPVIPGDPEKSLLVRQVSGPDPEMPAKGEKLTPDEVHTLAEWVRQGAKDDSPAAASAPVPEGFAAPGPPPAQAPAYKLAPVITA